MATSHVAAVAEQRITRGVDGQLLNPQSPGSAIPVTQVSAALPDLSVPQQRRCLEIIRKAYMASSPEAPFTGTAMLHDHGMTMQEFCIRYLVGHTCK